MLPDSTPPAAGTRVWLLRHAESADPTVFHGAESDIGLSPRGVAQADAVAGAVASFRPAAVISSAMRRAIATATPIAAACGLSLRTEVDLHERRVGALSGTPFITTDGVWAATLARWIAGDTGFAPDGAESFDQIRDRVLPVWNRVTTEFAGSRVAIIAHGVVCKVLLVTLVSGWTVAEWSKIGPIRNVGINELVWNGAAWELARLNEVVDDCLL